jgi:hypothetical protein
MDYKIEYFNNLKATVESSRVYPGDPINHIVLLQILNFNYNEIKILDGFFDGLSIDAIINYNSMELNSNELFEIFILCDDKKDFYIGVVVNPIELFSDSYLHKIMKIDGIIFKKLYSDVSYLAEYNYLPIDLNVQG